MIIVVAAIIRRPGGILITKRPIDVHLPGLWEFPGGKVEPGESLTGALRREIREELGIEIEVFEERFSTTHHYPSRSIELHFFECAIASGEPHAIEVADIRWVAPGELQSYEFPEADRDIVAYLSQS